MVSCCLFGHCACDTDDDDEVLSTAKKLNLKQGSHHRCCSGTGRSGPE